MHAQPTVCLDAELLGPGEGEVTAARRVVPRLVENHPWIEVFTLDALYLEAPLLRAIVESGRSAIVPLKSERRDLYKDVAALCGDVPPRFEEIDGERLEVWNLRDLPGWEGMEGIPIRVERTVRRYKERHRVARKWVEENRVQDWTWVVVGTLGQRLPLATIHRLGHARWDIENRAFNEQDRFHALDHCFKHDVKAIVNLLLTLFLAAAVTTLFFTRNLKDPSLRWTTLAGLVRLLLERPRPLTLPASGPSPARRSALAASRRLPGGSSPCAPCCRSPSRRLGGRAVPAHGCRNAAAGPPANLLEPRMPDLPRGGGYLRNRWPMPLKSPVDVPGLVVSPVSMSKLWESESCATRKRGTAARIALIEAYASWSLDEPPTCRRRHRGR